MSRSLVLIERDDVRLVLDVLELEAPAAVDPVHDGVRRLLPPRRLRQLLRRRPTPARRRRQRPPPVIPAPPRARDRLWICSDEGIRKREEGRTDEEWATLGCRLLELQQGAQELERGTPGSLVSNRVLASYPRECE